MVALSHLKSLQALELAVRLGSLKDAADALSITPAAVGQRGKVLEDYLGVDLLVRGRSGLRSTPALQGAMAHLAAAFRELDSVANVLDLQRGHEIHLAATSDFAELWLKPNLGRFRAAHPNILFCINGEGDAPLRLGPVDCEISFGKLRTGGGSEVLFRDYVLPINSPENAARISRLNRPNQLEGFPLLHLDFYKDDPAVPNWPDWIRSQRLRRTAPERGIRFQRITPALEAVLANAGLAICGLALISDLVDEGRLSLSYPISTGTWTEHAFQAHFRDDALARPQIRRFREWLVNESGATRDWLAQKTAAKTLKPKRPTPRKKG
jgi:LysR family glycine cleavage system transcriptional activator